MSAADLMRREDGRGHRRRRHRGHPDGRRRWSRGPDDRGSVIVEVVLVIPVVMAILVVLIQFALWAHAAQVAQLAASEGDRAARAFGGGAVVGQTRADSILQGRGSDLAASNAVVDVMPGDVARVTVTGTAISIVPGMALRVSSVDVGPIQEFRGSE